MTQYNVSSKKMKIVPGRRFVPTQVPSDYQPPEYNLQASSSASSTTTNSFIDGFEGFIDQSKVLFVSKVRAPISDNSMELAPTVTREEYNAVLKELDQQPHALNNYKDGIEDALEIKSKLYPQYTFELKQNFSLLFYGYGSKRTFLKELCEQYLSFNLNTSINDDDVDDGIPVLNVNGYNTQLNYREIYAEVIKYIQVDDEELVHVLEQHAKTQALSANDGLEFSDEELLKDENLEDNDEEEEDAKRKKKSSGESKLWGNSIHFEINNLIKYYNITNSGFDQTFKLIVCMHSFDGPQSHKPKFITFLTLLAQINCIAFVCSMDHVKSPMLYDHNCAVAFNFVYHDATNFRFYSLEHSFQYDSFQTVYHDTQYVAPHASSGLTASSKKTTDNSNTLTGVKYVLDSLTLNSKKMYKLLLETILGRKEQQSGRFNKAYRIEFKPFFDLCRDDFIVSNEMALRNMMREYIEHRMAIIAKNKRSGVEAIDVPYSELEIKMILKDYLSDI